MTDWTPERLIAFEDDIAARFQRGEIRAPIHLDGGNEFDLINYFKHYYTPGDWVCGTWRMHYKCLLAGVLEDKLRQAILDGNSITLCFPEHNIISSALVGHICSIAMGIALSIRRGNGTNKVHCFIGDMTHKTGYFHEAAKYAGGHGLPITWIIEDNGKSVTTNTREVWGEAYNYGDFGHQYLIPYTPRWPHQGTGKRVEF